MTASEFEAESILPDVEIQEEIPLPKIKGIPDFIYESVKTPGSIKDAKEQIVDFMCDIEQIRDQLDFNDKGDDEWRKRANSAMAISQSKIRILRRWIALNQDRQLESHSSEIKKLKNRITHLEDELIKLKRQHLPEALSHRIFLLESAHDVLSKQFCVMASSAVLCEIGDARPKLFVRNLRQAIEVVNTSRFHKVKNTLDTLNEKVAKWLESLPSVERLHDAV